MTILAAAAPQLHGILIGFLVIIIVLACLIGLLWVIEKYISPIPGIVKLILAIIILILCVIWAAGVMGISI